MEWRAHSEISQYGITEIGKQRGLSVSPITLVTEIAVYGMLREKGKMDKMSAHKKRLIDKSERCFSRILTGSGTLILLMLIAILFTLSLSAHPAIKQFGFGFFLSKTWNVSAESFGVIPFLVGTLVTSFLALIIAIPFSIAISMFLGEYFKEGIISNFLRSAVEVLAGIPSVIYGLWGVFILVPLVRALELKVGIAPLGVGILTSSLILAIMVIPYSASLGREVISLVPGELKEAAYSLGATRFEVMKSIIVPYARSGIIAGILLAFGRAIGETMAVTMLIGNSNFLPTSIFSPANTMASVIANQFSEATGIVASSLIYVALVLFLVTMIVNIIGNYVISKISIEASREVT